MTAPRVLRETMVVRDLDSHRLPPGRYVWRGGADAPVFAFRDSREIVCEDITVDCETPAFAVFRVERTNTNPGTHPSTMHQWRNVRINGKGSTYGFLFDDTIDQNNEHGRWDSCSVYHCNDAWRFMGSQSKEHLLTHCRAESCLFAVAADSSFQWIGGAIAAVNTAFHLERVGDPITVQGVGVESCRRLLVTHGPTSDAQPITLIGVRYAADQLEEDGAAIVMRHAGPLTIIGGSYGDGDQRVPMIHLAGVGEQVVNLIGAKFGAFGASEVHPVKVNPGVGDVITRQGCTYQTASSSPQRTTTLNAAPVGRA